MGETTGRKLRSGKHFWKCTNCRPAPRTSKTVEIPQGDQASSPIQTAPTASVGAYSELIKYILEEVKKIFQTEFRTLRREHSSSLDDIRKLIEGQTAIINDLGGRIENLKLENSNLKTRIMGLENTMHPHKIMHEINDRMNRAKNIILFGVEELEGAAQVERIKHDMAEVSKLINGIDENFVGESMRCIRLGREVGDRPRPLKVFLSSQEQVLNVLRNKRRLGDVRVANDLTAMQRDFLKQLNNELAERKRKGENDIFIRYLNGQPVITSRMPKNSIVEGHMN
jgi:hypothetical protein